MPTWSDPKIDYANGNTPTAAQLQNLIDNTAILKDRPYAEYIGPTTPDITTTSTTLVDLGSYTVDLSTTGGSLFCYFCATFSHGTANNVIEIKFNVTGTTGFPFGPSGARFVPSPNANYEFPICIFYIIPYNALTAGSHTIKMEWLTNGGTARLVSAYRSHLFVQEGIN